MARRQVFKRDGYRCVDCGRAGKLEGDHVVPLHRGGDGGAEVEIDLPDSDAGRDVLAAASSSGVVIRPYLDQRSAEYQTSAEGTRVYHNPVSIRCALPSR